MIPLLHGKYGNLFGIHISNGYYDFWLMAIFGRFSKFAIHNSHIDREQNTHSVNIMNREMNQTKPLGISNRSIRNGNSPFVQLRFHENTAFRILITNSLGISI